MARSVSCHDPLVGRSSDTLMPVSPSEEQISESLSHNGETEAVKDQEITTGRETQAPGESIPAETRSEMESIDGGGDTNGEEEVKEARIAIGRKSPKDPTRKEREEHELTHMPFRSRCEDCVKSRARNAHHRKRVDKDPLDEVKVARVHMDYFFMSREDESASSNPLFVIADEKSGARYARAVGKKGFGYLW